MKLIDIHLGDLIHAIGTLLPQDDETRHEIANILGFEFFEESRQSSLTSSETRAAVLNEPAPKAPQSQADLEKSLKPTVEVKSEYLPSHQPIESIIKPLESHLSSPPRWINEIEAMPEDPIPVFPLSYEPLFPVRWTRSIFTESLSTESYEGALDIDELVDVLANRKPLLQLPFLTASTLRRGVQLLIDVSAAMSPFKRDQDSLVKEVLQIVGADNVDIFQFEYCPSRGVFSEAEGKEKRYEPASSGATVLLLTDLGIGRPLFSSRTASETEWLSFARAVGEAGCSMTAYVPYGSDRWPRALEREMTILHWGRQALSGVPKTASATAHNAQAEDPRIRNLRRRNPCAFELAKILSLAARIEPELLRAARLRFLPQSDAGAEADLWFSSLVQSKSPMAMLLIPSIADHLRNELLAEGHNMLEASWNFMDEYRAKTGASHAIRCEEQIAYLALRYRDESSDEIKYLLRQALKALISSGEKRKGLARWVLSAFPLLPEQARALPEAKQLLWASKLRLRSRAIPFKELPNDAESLGWLLPSDLRTKPIGVRFIEGGLEITDDPTSEMPSIKVPETNPRILELLQEQGAAEEKRQVYWEAGETLVVDVNTSPLTVQTMAGQRYEIRYSSTAETTLQSILGMRTDDLFRLTKLDLSGKGLVELPAEFAYLTGLETLDLSDNLLTKLPDIIGQLTNLKTLNLSDNRLTNLPESINKLTRLRTLDLSGNQLTHLPETIGQLTELQSLYLSGNQLTELPEAVGQMINLKVLFLDGNQLAQLPESLRKLESLELLYLHGNHALGLPIEVLGPTRRENTPPTNPSDILQYYFRIRGGLRPLNEAKLILVGRGAVGKTSIVNRLVHNIFKDETKTEGLRITEWQIRLQTNEDVRLNIWNFGGQEIMHATHQFFLTQRSLYLLVLNGREGGEEAEAEYWLKLIESFGGESPVIVVMNKIKEHPFDLNRRSLQQRYPAIREFIKTDSEDGTGLDQLRKAIERETDRLEHLRDAFPASWFAIKDRLAGMRKNYLSFDEYRRLCQKLGEADKSAQEALAGYLHDLGLVLHYKDDPRLQDTHVLNPRWIINGIYKILNSERLERQKGEISLNDLPRILDGTQYPRRMHRFIFDLMKKFELCFSFPDDDMHYLIPELLDKQVPEESAEFLPKQCLNFQYHYTVLPAGLLARFIVRTHVLSEGQSRWRTGVILKFGDSRAMVNADTRDKKVFISVLGSTYSRRQLLAVIRSDFERIHNDIRNLTPLQMVPVPDYPDVVVPYKELLVMEQKGMTKFHKVANDLVIELDVQELLNGVDLEGARRTQRATEERIMKTETNAVRVFISYSHKDENRRNELQTHLKLLQRQGIIDAWDDRQIDAGDEWKRKIDDNLERADIILLLVSADFIASDYAYEIEMKRALERHDSNEARVIPIIVRDVNWRKAPFSKLQALPKDGKAVPLWPDKDTAWRNVAEGIENAAKQIRKKPKR